MRTKTASVRAFEPRKILCAPRGFDKVGFVFQRLTTLIAVAAVLFAAACTSSAPVIKAKGKSSIPAQVDNAHPEGKAHLFDEVTIHLPPIEKPGNRWFIVLNDERYLDPQAPIEAQPDGSAVAKFLALRAGRRSVRFFALPPTKEAVPTQRYEIRITIEEAK